VADQVAALQDPLNVAHVPNVDEGIGASHQKIRTLPRADRAYVAQEAQETSAPGRRRRQDLGRRQSSLHHELHFEVGARCRAQASRSSTITA
jgi:hypothetical protein